MKIKVSHVDTMYVKLCQSKKPKKRLCWSEVAMDRQVISILCKGRGIKRQMYKGQLKSTDVKSCIAYKSSYTRPKATKSIMKAQTNWTCHTFYNRMRKILFWEHRLPSKIPFGDFIIIWPIAKPCAEHLKPTWEETLLKDWNHKPQRDHLCPGKHPL